MIKRPFGLDKKATGPAWIKSVAGLINCLCGAMANWAFKGQIWGLALPVRAGFDKLAIGAGQPLINCLRGAIADWASEARSRGVDKTAT